MNASQKKYLAWRLAAAVDPKQKSGLRRNVAEIFERALILEDSELLGNLIIEFGGDPK